MVKLACGNCTHLLSYCSGVCCIATWFCIGLIWLQSDVVLQDNCEHVLPCGIAVWLWWCGVWSIITLDTTPPWGVEPTKVPTHPPTLHYQHHQSLSNLGSIRIIFSWWFWNNTSQKRKSFWSLLSSLKKFRKKCVNLEDNMIYLNDLSND